MFLFHKNMRDYSQNFLKTNLNFKNLIIINVIINMYILIYVILS